MRTTIPVVTLLIAVPVLATTYTDPTGDIAVSNNNLDIISVDVSHTSTDVEISLTLGELSSDLDWGKYLLFFDFKFGGVSDNPWGRDVSGLSGIDMFVGTWLDGDTNGDGVNDGGLEQWYYTPNGWGQMDLGVSMSFDNDDNTITWNLAGFAATLAGFGASTFQFEIGTTGNGNSDPAIDLLGGEGTMPGWGQGSTSTDMSTYSIPAPGAIALLGLAGLAGRRRRR